MKKRRRNTIAVKLDLLDAVGSVLKKEGFTKLGINLVANKAKVDRNVIYRNFTNFDNLLLAYIENKDYWLSALKNYSRTEIEDHRSFMKQVLVEQFNTIYLRNRYKPKKGQGRID